VKVPRHVKDPSLGFDVTPGSDEQLGIVSARIAANGEILSQADWCTLPDSQKQICLASLTAFLATSEVGAHLSSGRVSTVVNSLTSFLSGVSTPAGTSSTSSDHKPVCRTAEDLSLEKELHKYKTQPIPIPANTIRLPSDIVGQVAVSFQMGDAQVCKSALNTGLPTPSLYVSGELAIGADSPTTGSHYGPFTYELTTVSWLPDPAMPAGQQLTTQFSAPSADASLNVHPSLSFRLAPDLALTVADAELHALPFDVTLVRDRQAQLQVGLGPTLVIDAQVSMKSVEQSAENTKAENGGDTVAAADDAAELTADDLAAALDEMGLEWYGVDLGPAARGFYVIFEGQLAAALQADPALVAFGVAGADVVAGDAITAGDAAAIDGAMGAGAIDVSTEEILVVFLF
jgi:hypothetical protein